MLLKRGGYMAQKPKNKALHSPQVLEQAESLAKANQRPGQTKEQTKLVAQGIAKGIEQYKKQQKSRKRELDKKAKKLDQQLKLDPVERETEVVIKQSPLAWALLLLSWVAFIVYQLLA